MSRMAFLRGAARRFAILVLAGGFAASATGAAWSPAGPAQGEQPPYFGGVATHPTAGGQAIVYAGYVPGVQTLASFFTTDGGAHWSSNARTGGYGRSFLGGNPTVAYLEEPGRILRSADQGRSWAPIGLPAVPFQSFVLGGVNPVDPDELVGFAGATVYRSVNGGASWSADAAPTTVHALSVDWSTRTLFASFSGNPSLGHRPVDVPGAWGVGGQDPFVFAAGHGVVLYRANAGGLFRSLDGGTTFVPVAQALGPVPVCEFAFAASPSGRVYAVECDTGRILRSEDDGATWNIAGTIAEEAVRTPAVDAADPDRLYVTTNDGPRASDDGGVTFSVLSRAAGAPGGPWAQFFDAAAPARRWLSALPGSDPATLRSEDGGATWDSVGTPYRLIGASRTRPRTLFGTGSPGLAGDYGIWLSIDGGDTWQQKIGIFGSRGTSVGPMAWGQGPGELFVAGTAAGLGNSVIRSLFYSNDDGNTFTERFAPPGEVRAMAATQTGGPALYAGGYPVSAGAPQLHRSTNGAVTWQPVATFPALLSANAGTYGNTLTALAIDPSNPGRLYAGFLLPDYVMRSEDAGATWVRATSGLGAGEITSLVIDPATPSTLYATQSGSGVFRSVDRGATWVAMDDGLHDDLVIGVVLDPQAAGSVIAATGTGLYRTDLGAGLPAGDRRAIEFYHHDMNHYFVSADLDEVAGLDAGVFQGWTRTGEGFRVAEASAPGNEPVCRFFAIGFAPISTHFYTPYSRECDLLKADPDWTYEKIAFGLALPDPPPGRGCRPGTRALHRLWNQNLGGAPNHRYTTSRATFDAMVEQGWVFEGEARTQVFACLPY